MEKFDEQFRDEVWRNASPKDGRLLALEFLLAEARHIKDDKATAPELKVGLESAIEALEFDLQVYK
jgi:hypothetical protein